MHLSPDRSLGWLHGVALNCLATTSNAGVKYIVLVFLSVLKIENIAISNCSLNPRDN